MKKITLRISIKRLHSRTKYIHRVYRRTRRALAQADLKTIRIANQYIAKINHNLMKANKIVRIINRINNHDYDFAHIYRHSTDLITPSSPPYFSPSYSPEYSSLPSPNLPPSPRSFSSLSAVILDNSHPLSDYIDQAIQEFIDELPDLEAASSYQE